MGYQDLLRALREEVTRQAGELRAEAERERERVLAEARRTAAAERAQALARVGAEMAAERHRELGAAALDRERRLLVEKRRLLEELREDVGRRLSSLGDESLASALADEVAAEAAEAGGGPLELWVDPGQENSLRDHLARRWPEVARRTTVFAVPTARGGVELRFDRVALDDTLPARLQQAWTALEDEIAAALFRGGDAAP